MRSHFNRAKAFDSMHLSTSRHKLMSHNQGSICKLAPELPYIISPDNEDKNRLLLILEKAYLESRYANNFSVSDNDIFLLTEAAEVLHGKVKELFQVKLEALD